MLENFPLYCPRCRQESLINEPDAKTQSRSSLEGVRKTHCSSF
ncbi:hypothetical protein HCR03_05325 [Caproicibacter fermentans]|uniref:Uncharacterized protein n=1 Tax=Caproicibacter fermentans TaxID=2576756 RepID=A0A7G8TFY8_9FIRM|nr:hypothetical protein HCR03_05325 [Caproicibacter fermentans]